MAFCSYRELIVWQKAMDLVDEVYLLVKELPKEEQFALSNQLRRAVVSIPSNIAEGQGRNTRKDFIQFLSIARGSVFEVETQLLICVRQHYFSEAQAHKSLHLCAEVGRILTKMTANPK